MDDITSEFLKELPAMTELQYQRGITEWMRGNTDPRCPDCEGKEEGIHVCWGCKKEITPDDCKKFTGLCAECNELETAKEMGESHADIDAAEYAIDDR